MIARANACDMGLSAYAFTRSPERARRTVAELKAGHGRDQLFRPRRIGSALRRHEFLRAWDAKAAARALRDYLDTKLAQMVF